MTTVSLLAALALGQPDVAFARGVEQRSDAKAARPHFIDAAKGYDAEWHTGTHSPALAMNRSRAHALAGDLPGAILAAHSGLNESPTDVELTSQLETLRNAVDYPPGTRPEKSVGLRTRVSPWDVFFVALVGVVMAVVGVARRFTSRDGWAVWLAVAGAGVLATAGVMTWLLHREAAGQPTVLVLVRPTTLRTGNGDTYPSRLDAELPRGAEVSGRLRRGGWVQVELPGGVIGWVSEASTRGE